MSATDDDIALEDVIEGDADAEAYNAQVENRFARRRAELAEAEQEAVDALLEEAEASAETTTVEFPSGLELEVQTRIPAAVETRLQRLEHLEDRDADTQEIARVNCEALAAMVTTDGYDEADVWMTAYEKNGLQWLSEMTERIVEPAASEAEALGNRVGR